MARPAYKGKEVKAALLRKGFKEGNSHHAFLYLYIDGRKTSVHTKISHDGKKPYTDGLWSCLKKQLHLTDDGLCELIECNKSYSQYVGLLRQDGIL